ncbi:tRNA pseudouridine synthase 10 [Trypanosoma rangeli]|uniref:tRNA pseudouridine(55) synthase n=1 Tax=Trypanosoma rangeli TaxID=5698 RepID=A0A422MV99_TRYRA|nr:tRNA pseudouridine synthase 10 [Trypanosoma rangeli]RNE97143.1 tRNA pseudouridine synthase 10 [Trypanosoma rangeli]|eukprot:RNE97143.1 tRNA pseudouridine synthase 10 [Trypanosoma rangeli]
MEPRDALCYACALRMSIMHQVPPPAPLSQVCQLNDGGDEGNSNSDGTPFVDDIFHPHFFIVYETPRSALRFLDLMRENTMDVVWCQRLPFLCCACLGLYQFIDYVYAPAVAAAVRTSPYTDSDCLSVNVNVHRSLSLLWLMVSAVFYGVRGREGTRPKPFAVIPEEHCNFKDFFMSDLRARILQYTMYPHSAIKDKKTPVGYETYLREIERRCKYASGGTEPQTLQAFTYSPENEGVVVDICCEHHRLKDLAGGDAVPPQYCSNRCEGMITYSVLYDYVQPYLEKSGWWANTEAAGEHVRHFVVEETATLCCSLQHSNILLIGNYRKMKRDLSQSPWFVNGERVGTFSLQEIIANPILSFFFPEGVTSVPVGAEAHESALQSEKRTRYERVGLNLPRPEERQGNPHQMAAQHVFGFGRYKFHSAGREDVDVRMLGGGRPFVLEVISPSRQQVMSWDLSAFEEAVNNSEKGSVEISDLRVTDADITVRLARHSQSKVKKYRCVVWCSRAIVDPSHDEYFQAANAVRDLTIEQRTPIRVLHRRSMQVRPRMIHSIQLTPLNAHWFLMDLETQAGTYVKEFVHGDMGRTRPHLGALLKGRTDIIQLDVLGMAMEGL